MIYLLISLILFTFLTIFFKALYNKSTDDINYDKEKSKILYILYCTSGICSIISLIAFILALFLKAVSLI